MPKMERKLKDLHNHCYFLGNFGERIPIPMGYTTIEKKKKRQQIQKRIEFGKQNTI